MISPEYSEFTELAKQGNFVPLYMELVADLDTPVSAWYRVCQGQPYSFLLESVEGGERLGRFGNESQSLLAPCSERSPI